MRKSLIAAAAGLAVTALGGSAAQAADPTITLNPETITLPADPAEWATTDYPVDVEVTGVTDETSIVYISQCGKDGNADPTFSEVFDCSDNNEVNPTLLGDRGNQFGNGTIKLFFGDEPGIGLFVCDLDTDCYVRAAPSTPGNLSTDAFKKFGWEESTPVIPEVPWNLLLPASAVAVAGGAALIARKRQGLAL